MGGIAEIVSRQRTLGATKELCRPIKASDRKWQNLQMCVQGVSVFAGPTDATPGCYAANIHKHLTGGTYVLQCQVLIPVLIISN